MTLFELHTRQKEAEARAEDARAAFRAALHAAREKRTLADIGRELGVTKSRVWQLCQQGEETTK